MDGTVLYKQWQVRTSITVRWKCFMSAALAEVALVHLIYLCSRKPLIHSLFAFQYTVYVDTSRKSAENNTPWGRALLEKVVHVVKRFPVCYAT